MHDMIDGVMRAMGISNNGTKSRYSICSHCIKANHQGEFGRCPKINSTSIINRVSGGVELQGNKLWGRVGTGWNGYVNGEIEFFEFFTIL